MAKHLTGLRVAILTMDGFEQLEVTVPARMLRRQGADVDIVSLRPGRILGMNFLWRGKKLKADTTVFNAEPLNYDALYIPGGFIAPDLLRQSTTALDFVRAFDSLGKPIASMCHGPWLLVSAGLAAGRKLTSWPGIQDDIRNAGAEWVNEAAVIDGNWLTSRGPHDLLAFNDKLVEHFAPDGIERRRIPIPGRGASWTLATLAAIASGWAVGAWLRQERDVEFPFRPKLPVTDEDVAEPIRPVDAGYPQNTSVQ